MGFLSIIRRTGILACVTLSFIVVAAEEDDRIPKLPYCNPDADGTTTEYDKLVYVSTLDGFLSALNLESGSLVWNIETGPGPMLSSSIHRRELSNNGHWVRMIPSLSGSLYKFNGESIEAIPITADNLLQSSSFIFSDEVLIAGGKESRTYGIEVQTGRLLYECSMKGCTNYTGVNSYSRDTVVVQRQTQTVRAVEARSGEERWNFSVGLHDLKYLSESGADCQGVAGARDVSLPFELKVIVPNGLICAVSKEKPEKIIWKHKFDSPIVTAWLMKDGKSETVDLFSGSQWSSPYRDAKGLLSPSLYLGMHKMQLYVQESVTVQKKYSEIGDFIAEESDYPRIPWNPIPATGSLLGIDVSNSKEETALQPLDTSATTQAVLYGTDYIDGNGYYLFSEEGVKRAQNMQCSVSGQDNSTITANEIEVDEETPVQVIIVSLWYWWKEVLVISISTAVLLNLLTQKFRYILKEANCADFISEEQKSLVKHPSPQEHDSGVDLWLPTRSHSEPGALVDNSHGFVSRYLTDFEPIQCLGRGGFGVVFEAKNKIDDCRYAIKRITLPNNRESRERVMREVKALAKLDHHHIVRYFNAWVECPPPGWRQQHDSVFVKPPLEDATSIDLSQLSKDLPSDEDYVGHSSQDSKYEVTSSLNSHNVVFDRTSFSETKPPRAVSDEDDSFVVFENSAETQKVDESTAPQTLDERGHGDSVISLESESESSQTRYGYLSKRPASLNIRADGSVVPALSTSVFLYIQMQLCHRESLREWLRDNISSRDLHKIFLMFEQIVQAVEYVHLQGLIHRDLKPSNIFFSLNGQIKVGDFGLVTAMVENTVERRTPCGDMEEPCGRQVKHTAQVGTETYMSPEQLKGLPYDYKVDIYSLGLIFFELLVPFGTQMERHRTLMDLRQNKFPSDFQDRFKNEYTLLRLMLSHTPEDRPTTFGIRARPPLRRSSEGRCPLNGEETWDFCLPPRKKTTSFSNSSSVESWDIS